MALAAGTVSANSRPIPTVCAPWPGKRKAVDMRDKFEYRNQKLETNSKFESKARCKSPVQPVNGFVLRAYFEFRYSDFEFLCLLFFLHHCPSHVMAAVVADGVRRDGVAALRAIGQLLGLFMIVGPAAAGLLIRLSSLGDGHDKFLC